MNRGVSIYLIVGLCVASAIDLHQMQKPLPYGRYRYLRCAIATVMIVMWMPILATAVGLATVRWRRRVKSASKEAV